MSGSPFLKIITSASAIAYNSRKNVLDKCHKIIEDNFLQEKYVSREEFENLKSLVVLLQAQLAEQNKHKSE